MGEARGEVTVHPTTQWILRQVMDQTHVPEAPARDAIAKACAVMLNQRNYRSISQTGSWADDIVAEAVVYLNESTRVPPSYPTSLPRDLRS